MVPPQHQDDHSIRTRGGRSTDEVHIQRMKKYTESRIKATPARILYAKTRAFIARL